MSAGVGLGPLVYTPYIIQNISMYKRAMVAHGNTEYTAD